MGSITYEDWMIKLLSFWTIAHWKILSVKAKSRFTDDLFGLQCSSVQLDRCLGFFLYMAAQVFVCQKQR